MINGLTKEQESQIPLFIEKWMKYASTTMNKKKAIDIINKMYDEMGHSNPIIIVGDSPFNTFLLSSLFSPNVKGTSNQLSSQLFGKFNNKLYGQLFEKFHTLLYFELYLKLNRKLYNDPLSKKLNNQLYLQLCEKFNKKPFEQFSFKENNCHWGLLWLDWCGWYDYLKYIGVEFDKETYDLYINFNSEIHYIIPYENIAFVSEKPVEMNTNNRLLHADGKPAVKYKDGYSIWCLNGVSVSKEIAILFGTIFEGEQAIVLILWSKVKFKIFEVEQGVK